MATRRRQRRRRTRKGGAGVCGSRNAVGTIHRFAKYWYNTMNRDVWYGNGEGQSGYYFTNRHGCETCYQDQTHVHIYEIVDNDTTRDGMKLVKWASKRDNKQAGTGETEMLYTNIAGWLDATNNALGQTKGCAPS